MQPHAHTNTHTHTQGGTALELAAVGKGRGVSLGQPWAKFCFSYHQLCILQNSLSFPKE